MSIDLKVPAVGESITEVYIGSWHKQEGDFIRKDEEVVELESEKATFDAPSPTAGILKKILKQPGEMANVGEVIAQIEETDEPAGAGDRTESTPSAQATADGGGDGTARVMPAAQRALADRGLSAEEVEASGPGGRLLKEDVLRHKSTGQRSTTGRASNGDGHREEETVPMSPIRLKIAERLVHAQQTAALLTTFNEADMSAVMTLRKQYRDAFLQKYDVKLGFMSFFVKAAIDALKLIPQVNAEIRDNRIVYRNYFDIGVAIGSGKGLVVPVLRNAERMSFAEIELTIHDFATRAQQNRLDLDEMRGGTFTISNGGVYGSMLSTPIVNPPQSGVLGMHAIQDRPMAVAGEVLIRPMMYLALTYDHRIVDGREAVTFLKRIKDSIEEPARMLIEV